MYHILPAITSVRAGSYLFLESNIHIMANTERVCIFIDGSNFYHCMRKDLGDMKIDFEKISQKLCGKDRKLIRTYYYNAPLDMSHDKESYKKQQKFFSGLRNIPNFKLVLVRLQKRKVDGKTHYAVKGDDIHIAVDMVMLAQSNSYDTAILVSGDGDFVPAVKAAQSFGKHIENAHFKSGHSWHLRQTCDRSVLMDNDFMKKCTL